MTFNLTNHIYYQKIADYKCVFIQSGQQQIQYGKKNRRCSKSIYYLSLNLELNHQANLELLKLKQLNQEHQKARHQKLPLPQLQLPLPQPQLLLHQLQLLLHQPKLKHQLNQKQKVQEDHLLKNQEQENQELLQNPKQLKRLQRVDLKKLHQNQERIKRQPKNDLNMSSFQIFLIIKRKKEKIQTISLKAQIVTIMSSQALNESNIIQIYLQFLLFLQHSINLLIQLTILAQSYLQMSITVLLIQIFNLQKLIQELVEQLIQIQQYLRYQIMAKVGQAELLKRFKKVDFKSVELLTTAQQVKGLFSQVSLQPENNKPAQDDPNDIYISPNHDTKKKKTNNPNLKIGKQDSHNQNPTHHHNQQQHGHGHGQQTHEQRQKVYKPGPFALFYKLNQGKQNKDEQVWYYKDHKQIVGPVSSYNMDIMVYFKTVQQDTKVAFKNIDKFVKFQKIKKIVDEEKQKLQES